MIAAVPISVLAAGGSAPAAPTGAQLAGVAVPAETNTTTGIGRSLCHIIGTQACSDSPSPTTSADSGNGTDTSAGTETTTAATSGPPQSRLCGSSNVKLPSCATTSSSTVTVAPPSTLHDTSTGSSKTSSTRGGKATKTSRTKTRAQSATTVTVTVTQSSSSSSTATTNTGTP